MRKCTVQALVLGSIGIVVGAVCSLAIFTPNTKTQDADNAFSVSIREQRGIRSVGEARSPHLYNCRASAESCALAAVQEICGKNKYQITFTNVRVDATGKLDGEWGYRCLSRSSVL